MKNCNSSCNAVPTMETIEMLIDELASLKINQVDHTTQRQERERERERAKHCYERSKPYYIVFRSLTYKNSSPQVQLYMEHTFAYKGHEQVWKDASPFTGILQD